jgi:excisionase family DNA binding protein
MPKDLITAQEAARRLGVPIQTIHMLLRTGRMRGYKVQGLWRLDPADLGPAEMTDGTRGGLRPGWTVSYVRAGTLLGMSRQGVHYLVQRGALEAIENPLAREGERRRHRVITRASLEAEMRRRGLLAEAAAAAAAAAADDPPDG